MKPNSGRRDSMKSETSKSQDMMGQGHSRKDIGGRATRNKASYKGDTDGGENIVGKSEVSTKAAGNSFGL